MNKMIEIIKKNYKPILFVLLLFIGVLTVLSNRGTHSLEEMDVYGLNILCSDSVNKGEEFECHLSLNLEDTIAKGLTVNFILDDTIEFMGFSSETWEISTSDGNGMVLVNLDGVTGDVIVGKIKFKMSDLVETNSFHKIELVNATIGDGDSTVLKLDDIFTNIKIKSGVNTLDNIVLDNGKLNEEFDKELLGYSAFIDSDKVVVTVTKTDENSSVTGDGELSLRYGTNVFEIEVTAEDGSKRMYMLNLYRNFEFNSDIYNYNREGNYVYTGIDSGDEILSNILLTDDLSKEIVDNKLIVSYEGQMLAVIDILNIRFNNNIFVNDKLNVGNNITYDAFMNNIEYSDSLNLKIFNNEEEVTPDELIVNGMVLKVYYGDTLLDSYSISESEVEYEYKLVFDDTLVVDNESKYIKYLYAGTTISQIKSLVTVTDGDVEIFDKDGNKKNDDDIVYTGDVLKSYFQNEIKDEYEIAVIGDGNGDGKFSIKDLTKWRQHYVKINELSGVYEIALDFDQNGSVSINDLINFRKAIVNGYSKTLEQLKGK